MLTKHQDQALRWLRRFCFYMEQVPVTWDPKHKRISTNTQLGKWIFWWIGNFFVFILWYTCVHTLSTQLFLHRKELKLLPTCILTTGFCCFTATLSSARGITAMQSKLYQSAVNEYIQLELKFYKKYHPKILDPNKPMNLVDLFFLIGQGGNLLPFLIYIVCMFWDLDGPYWVIEDFAPDAKYRKLPTIILFLLIRTFLLIPGFLETTRTIIYTGMGYLCVVIYLKDMTSTLSSKVKTRADFFRYYSQLQIISNVLGPAFEKATFTTVSIFYFMFVQTIWIVVCGFGHLDFAVYLFFASYAVIIITAWFIFLPMVARVGEIVSDIPRQKRIQTKGICVISNSVYNKEYSKKAVALRPIRFSYGSFYPLGRQFSRNVFDNMVQNLLSMVLLFDINGRRHQ